MAVARSRAHSRDDRPVPFPSTGGLAQAANIVEPVATTSPPLLRRLRRSQSEDQQLRGVAIVPTTLETPEPQDPAAEARPNLTSSTSAPLSCGRSAIEPGTSGSALSRPDASPPKLLSEEAGRPRSSGGQRHRRSISLQEGRTHAHTLRSREPRTKAAVAVAGGSEVEELEGYVQRLGSEIRQLEAKLDDFKRNSQGWVGLEEKRNRKKFVEEMGRTLAANRKRLQTCHKRLRATLAKGGGSHISDHDSDENNNNDSEDRIKELLDACLKPQETFFGLLRRLRERPLCLDKYYYYQDSDDDGNDHHHHSTDTAAADAASAVCNPGEFDTPLAVPSPHPCFNTSLSLPVFPSRLPEPPLQALRSSVHSASSHNQLPAPYDCSAGGRLGDSELRVCYSDIRFKEGLLGQGCFGAVYPASLPRTGPVAVKILKPGPHQRLSFQREVEALKRTLESCPDRLAAAPSPPPPPPPPPPIIRLCGYCAEPHACILTELCEGGSLESVLRRGTKMSDREVARVGMRVAEAMRILLAFDPPIFHRDLSTANILLRKQGDYASACLADFGIAVSVVGGETYPEGVACKSKNGNPRYRAPEVTLTGRYNKKSDVFSFGLVLFEMATGTVPFAEVEVRRVARHIAEGHPPRFPKGTTTDKRLQRLVKKCCRRNADRRPDWAAISRTLAKIDAAAGGRED